MDIENSANINPPKSESDASSGDIIVTNDTLRKMIGILGMLLPFLLYVCLFMSNRHTSPLPSISHYYFTRVCGIFLIIVGTLALFLLAYQGNDRKDFYISSLAGIFALCLLLFPTNNLTKIYPDAKYPYCITIIEPSSIRNSFHYISAAIFLSCLAYMSIAIFTISDKPAKYRTRRKRIRNRIYRTCGVIMILAILVMLAGLLNDKFCLNIALSKYLNNNHFVFWMETIAIESFGISWLVKSEAVLKD